MVNHQNGKPGVAKGARYRTRFFDGEWEIMIVQGHGERVIEAFGIDQALEELTLNDPNFQPVAYHGTTPENAERILVEGFRTHAQKRHSRKYAYVADQAQNCVKPGSGKYKQKKSACVVLNL